MRHPAPAHRLEHIVGELRALAEVDLRLLGGARDVGIGGEVDDDIVARHDRRERVHVVSVAAHDAEARVAEMAPIVPFAARRKIIVEGDRGDLAIGQQSIGEVAAQEARTPHDRIAGSDILAGGGVRHGFALDVAATLSCH